MQNDTELSPIEGEKNILNVLTSIKGKELKIFCWQPDGDLKRGITVSSKDIVCGQNFLIFTKENLDKFNCNEDIFFYYEPKTIIFKSKILKKNPGHLVCELPTDLRLKETRVDPRTIIQHGSSFLRISKKNRNSTPTRYRVGLMDISEGGASFVLNEFQIENLSIGENIRIHGIQDLIINPMLLATICYLTPFKIMGVKVYKVGISFERKLTKSEISETLP